MLETSGLGRLSKLQVSIEFLELRSESATDSQIFQSGIMDGFALKQNDMITVTTFVQWKRDQQLGWTRDLSLK